MTTIAENRKIMQAVAWFMGACILAAILTSCSPYAAMSPIGDTPTPAPSVTATEKGNNVVTFLATPRPSCTVTAYTLNMRAGAGMRYAVKQILERGEIVTVIRRGDWLKIETPQRVTGWVYGKYCQEVTER
jgi:uncharacterized protein YgiM (DUF1202 family)